MKSNHKVHKYLRIKLGDRDYVVMKCMLENCPHFIRLELALGRLCECWRCGREFVLTQKHLKLKKPHCDECTKSRLDEKVERLVGT